MKRTSVEDGDYFYHNKTIDGEECIIIKSKLNGIFFGTETNVVVLEPFHQYSDGSFISEPDFVTASLNADAIEAPSEEWNRTFGGAYDDYGQSVQQTSDGGYTLIGSIESYRPGMGPRYVSHVLFLKTDTNGSEQWSRGFEEHGLRNVCSVCQTSDGGYIFAGWVHYEVGLIKTDAEGNQRWDKRLRVTDNDHARSVQQTSDGGYILAGFSHDTNDAWLIKTDANGNPQWNMTFGGPEMEYANSVQQTSDGGYILAGSTHSYGSGGADAWIVKTDANGNEQWDKTFGRDGLDVASSIVQTSDGGYIFAGQIGSCGSSSTDAWIVKTDVNGNEQWNKTFGLDGGDAASSVHQTIDGGYILAGNIDTAKNPDFKGEILYVDYDVWLIKTDASGNPEWSRTFGGLRGEKVRSVQQTSDGGYILAGNTESYGSGGSDFWLIKVEGVGAADTTLSEVQTSNTNRTETNGTEGGEYDVQIPPEKSIPGFGFLEAIFSVIIIIFLKRLNK
ncbi:MAG: hypothetical protein U9Q37_05610 [Euryarchaeota archaeon]|nr:hypothetical protein [Euryarchaeota archaeon]